MQKHILIVDDEPAIRDMVAFALRKGDFEPVHAGDAREAQTAIADRVPDLILLDWMLPGTSGLELARRWRKDALTRDVPIIMLTARGVENDRVGGLEAGVDEYVVKPFSARELLARIRAVLRRGQDVELLPDTLEAGPVRMDVERHVVTVGGAEIRLPLKEFELLEMLLRNTGRVLTRGQLIDRIWGADYVGDTKTLDVHVKRLRSKLEKDPSNPSHLVTVRGLGYKFEA
jgi:two-component system response regulator RegX3